MPATTMHVRRAVGGDLRSLDWLAQRLSPLLLVQARYRLGPALRASTDPEDLVNEAWAVVLPRLGELDPRQGRLTPVLLRFLSTTMTFRINNLLRARLKARGGTGETQLSQLPQEQSGVITRAVRSELRETVRRHLEELETIDQEIIVLRGIEQHPAKAVAVMLGISPQAVDKRYSRALARLRVQLPESVFDEMDD